MKTGASSDRLNLLLSTLYLARVCQFHPKYSPKNGSQPGYRMCFGFYSTSLNELLRQCFVDELRLKFLMNRRFTQPFETRNCLE